MYIISFKINDLCLDQCCNRGTGGGRRWIRSRVGAGEPTAKSGGAPEMWWPGRSTVSATCTEGKIVQESLWKPPLPPPHPTAAPVNPAVLTTPLLGKLAAAVVPLISHFLCLRIQRIFSISTQGMQLNSFLEMNRTLPLIQNHELNSIQIHVQIYMFIEICRKIT